MYVSSPHDNPPFPNSAIYIVFVIADYTAIIPINSFAPVGLCIKFLDTDGLSRQANAIPLDPQLNMSPSLSPAHVKVYLQVRRQVSNPGPRGAVPTKSAVHPFREGGLLLFLPITVVHDWRD